MLRRPGRRRGPAASRIDRPAGSRHARGPRPLGWIDFGDNAGRPGKPCRVKEKNFPECRLQALFAPLFGEDFLWRGKRGITVRSQVRVRIVRGLRGCGLGDFQP